MHNTNKLTLEQEFKLKLYESKISKLNNRNVKKYLTKILRIMIIKDNVIKYCVKNLIN
uniref:phycobilisome degradation protein n=1 Tax=Palisada intermedia TaxID=397057 RepID=UPI00286AD144|nr:phycobilisome degradation protein [Palisada intermedia]WKW95778.1 phycobilisome degradation protein [Palisada intermedia]